jgi:hypothetical protein
MNGKECLKKSVELSVRDLNNISIIYKNISIFVENTSKIHRFSEETVFHLQVKPLILKHN